MTSASSEHQDTQAPPSGSAGASRHRSFQVPADPTVFSCLSFLHDPPKWIDRVNETIDVERNELVRNVHVDLRVPDGDFAAEVDLTAASSSEFPFNFIALRPRKSVLVSVSEATLGSGKGVRRLGHQSHVLLCQTLIWSRFLTVCGDLMARALAEGHRVWLDECLNVVEDLMRIPDLPAVDADKVLRRHFADYGQARWLDGRVCPHAETVRLYKLCLELSQRYYVAFEFQAAMSESVQISYSYREHWVQHRSRPFSDRVREYLGSMPTAFRVRIPYARLSDHYDVRMDAPAGYFFNEQQLLTFRAQPRHEASRQAFSTRALGWRARRQDDMREVSTADPAGGTSAEGLLPNLSVEIGGATTAHLFVGHGRRAKSTLYAGFRLSEIPPGSLGSAWLSLSVSVVLAGSLLWWLSNFATKGSDIPVLLVGLASLVPLAVQSFLPRVDIVRIPLLSRVYLSGQALAMVLFAIWLLGRSSDVRGHRHGYVKWWNVHGGPAIASLMLLGVCHGLGRLWRASRNHRRIISRQ